MATKWQTFPVKFTGGLVTNLGRLEQGLQAPGSATILKNFEPAVTTGYSRILGYQKYSTTAVPGSGNIVGVVIINEGKCLAYRDADYYTSVGTTWTKISDAPSSGSSRLRHDSFNWDGTEKWVLVDGINDPAIYNPVGDVVTYDTDAPDDVTGATLVKVFKNHIFFAKDNFLTFCAPYTTDDYNTGNGSGVINIGNAITGLAVFRDQLIVFTRNTIHYLSGNTSSDFVLAPITLNTGCLNPDSVQDVGGDIMYLGPDGVRFLSATQKNEDFALERASSNIQDQINEAVRKNTPFSSIVIRSKNQYRLFPYESSTSKLTSKGFLSTRYADQQASNIQWSTLEGFKVYTADNKQFSDREVILFSSGIGDDYVYKMEVGNSFDGANIHAVFQTPFMPITDPRIRKTIYKHSVYVNMQGSMSLKLNLLLDYNVSNSIQPDAIVVESSGGTTVWGEGTWGAITYAGRSSDTYVSQTVGSGFVFALKYETNNTLAPFTLDYTILEYRENERR